MLESRKVGKIRNALFVNLCPLDNNNNDNNNNKNSVAIRGTFAHTTTEEEL